MYIILATSNVNKRIEINNIFSHYEIKGIEVVSFSDFIKPFEIVENGSTFAQNAKIKAKAIYEALSEHFSDEKSTKNFLVLSEDSGLCIEALNGAPSVYSARFKDINIHNFACGSHHTHFDDDNLDTWVRYQTTLPRTLDTDSINVERVVYELGLRGLESSNATFVANMCLFGKLNEVKNPLCEHFEGILKGRVVTQKSGDKGFGYDPIFIPDGYTQTLAQIPNKDSLSHRKMALEQCVEFLRKTLCLSAM